MLYVERGKWDRRSGLDLLRYGVLVREAWNSDRREKIVKEREEDGTILRYLITEEELIANPCIN